MRLLDSARHVLRDVHVFVFPSECAGCGLPDVGVCSDCGDALSAHPRLVDPQSAPATLTIPVVSAGEYDVTLARVLHAIKDGGRAGIARVLSARFADTIRAFERGFDVDLIPAKNQVAGEPLRLVAPPSSRDNRRVRGFEPLNLIAHHAGVRLWQPLVSSRRRADQSRLGLSARADNMRNSMSTRANVTGASVVLVDDVMTTGATLTEMTRALHDAGAHVRGAVVLGHAVRRWPHPRSRQL